MFDTKWKKVFQKNFFSQVKMFFGEKQKKYFFFPWKNIFVLIKVKRFSLKNFFFYFMKPTE